MRQGAGPCAKPDLVRTRLEMEMKESGMLGKEDEEMNAVKALCEDGQLDEAIERIRSKGGKPRPSVVNLAMEYAVVIFKDVAGTTSFPLFSWLLLLDLYVFINPFMSCIPPPSLPLYLLPILLSSSPALQKKTNMKHSLVPPSFSPSLPPSSLPPSSCQEDIGNPRRRLPSLLQPGLAGRGCGQALGDGGFAAEEDENERHRARYRDLSTADCWEYGGRKLDAGAEVGREEGREEGREGGREGG